VCVWPTVTGPAANAPRKTRFFGCPTRLCKGDRLKITAALSPFSMTVSREVAGGPGPSSVDMPARRMLDLEPVMVQSR
jgi:hypothetical protein